ncbi:uncharacterized protein BDR25DRAFT_359221 [Lindgomyces ingoldianus]|uniref:Uncharacterized protein n=1 Tax=Lindgomyces ingoldianus TaxID=673940 RepID=A0ACB6QI83_9PLEO|nr:uncharacterized protein BDR25DRAFT_359221 [Lindgomyces ingoldianus]KAF2466708.1 hypothetical protein BDR25DRAFT_359221 [Lindgomyces ingoldianus]
MKGAFGVNSALDYPYEIKRLYCGAIHFGTNTTALGYLPNIVKGFTRTFPEENTSDERWQRCSRAGIAGYLALAFKIRLSMWGAQLMYPHTGAYQVHVFVEAGKQALTVKNEHKSSRYTPNSLVACSFQTLLDLPSELKFVDLTVDFLEIPMHLVGRLLCSDIFSSGSRRLERLIEEANEEPDRAMVFNQTKSRKNKAYWWVFISSMSLIAVFSTVTMKDIELNEHHGFDEFGDELAVLGLDCRIKRIA